MSAPLRSLVKIGLALCIPAGIGYFFYCAQQQADIEVKKFKEEQKAHPTSDHVQINDYALKEVDDTNSIRWQLIAKTGSVSSNNQDVALEEVKVEYFDPTTKAMKMRLSAPIGTANQSTKFVKLNSAKGRRVLAEGEGGKSKFTCEQVELIKKNQFLATGGVIIEWPGVAKVSGNSATGSTDLANGPKDFKVVGNTHAEIEVK